MKNETVIGTIGKTQGVISIAKPHRIASSTRLHKERCPTPELSSLLPLLAEPALVMLPFCELIALSATAFTPAPSAAEAPDTEESVAMLLFADIPPFTALLPTTGLFAAGRVTLKSLSPFTQLPSLQACHSTCATIFTGLSESTLTF